MTVNYTRRLSDKARSKSTQEHDVFMGETFTRILPLECFLLPFSQTLEPRRGKRRYRFLGKRDRLWARWHSICSPIVTSIFVHNWVRRENTYACNYCNHRQKIIANQYPFRDMKENTSTWDAKAQERRSFSWCTMFIDFVLREVQYRT